MRYIVPVRSLGQGKSRLSSILNPKQLNTLNAFMLEHLVDVLSNSKHFQGVLVVTRDPDVVKLASKLNVETKLNAETLLVAEEGGDLNSDLTSARLCLSKKYNDAICVLPSDLINIDLESINNLVSISLRNPEEVVIAPCKRENGTNALVLPSTCSLPLRYGENSFSQHCHYMDQYHQKYTVLRARGIAFDLDTVEDLKQLPQWNPVHSKAVEYLYSLPLYDDARIVLENDTTQLTAAAREIRNRQSSNIITYSRKVFIPLTRLCRDVCHYCTFAKTPNQVDAPYLSIEDVIDRVRAAKKEGCKEVLLTLGEKPERRYDVAKQALDKMGYSTTVDYVEAVAGEVIRSTGLLPHINLGCMSEEQMLRLRRVSASMGLMLESASDRLCEKGNPHLWVT